MVPHQLTRKQLLAMGAVGLLLFIVVACVVLAPDTKATAATMSASASASATEKGSRHATPYCRWPPINTKDTELRMVVVAMRHGPRTPITTYPNDPYIDSDFAPIGWGHLTIAGRRELFDRGVRLRQRYPDIFGKYYHPDHIHAQSTESPRTYMSLAMLLAGMFPPRGTAMEWSSTLNWQPIPIFSEPIAQDSFLLVRLPCARYAEARDEVLRLPEVRKMFAKNAPLFKNLTELTGMKVADAQAVNSLYITLEAELAFGLPLPAWTKDYFPEKLRPLAEMSYVLNTYTPEMRKIKGGPFLTKLFDDMDRKVAGTLIPATRTGFFYGVHDWSVSYIMAALNVWTLRVPQFSFTIFIELHLNKTTNEHHVEIWIIDENECLQRLKVPGCGEQCPLEKLKMLCADMVRKEPYDDLCSPLNSSYVDPPPLQVDAGGEAML